MKSTLVPKRIVDKNGNAKTVHVRPKKEDTRLLPNAPSGASADPVKALHAALGAALAVLDDPDFTRFPRDLQAGAILAVNSPDADESVYEKGNELAEACQSWNYHDAALKLWAGIGRGRLAANPEIPLVDIKAYAVAYDPLTPQPLLQRIYDEFGEVAHSLGENENTPVTILDELAKSDRDWLREKVARNPSISSETIDVLTNDPEWRVRWNLAQNTALAADKLEALSTDEQFNVRVSVAKNPNTPQYVIRALSGDGNNAVVEATQKRLR